MKNILIVMATLGMGGAEKSLISFLNSIEPQYLEKNEIKIDILIADKTGLFYNQIPPFIHKVNCPKTFKIFASPYSHALNESKIKVDVFFLKMLWKLRQKFIKEDLVNIESYWKANKNLIDAPSKKYDICLGYMNGLTSYYVIDKVHATKKILWVHNEYEKLGYTKDFQRRYFERASQIISVSELCIESLKNNFPEMAHKIKLIENISSTKIIYQQADEYFPKEYLNTDATKILTIGRLAKQKGYDLGIEAIKILKEKKINIIWHIIGGGELKEELSTLVNKYNLEDNIKFLGLKENPYPYIKNCDIFFQPSLYEGKSITLDEAKILNKPIVVTNYDTVYDSIEHLSNGVICEMNPMKLADGLLLLINDNDLSCKLSSNLQKQKNSNENEIYKYYALFE